MGWPRIESGNSLLRIMNVPLVVMRILMNFIASQWLILAMATDHQRKSIKTILIMRRSIAKTDNFKLRGPGSWKGGFIYKIKAS